MSCLPHGHSKILPLFGMKDIVSTCSWDEWNDQSYILMT